MIKEHFTDGLISLAIILSLLKTDLHNYQNVLNNYSGDFPEIHEIILGTTSAYTQTHFHQHNWHPELGGYIHPKNVDSYVTDYLSDVHSLGNYQDHIIQNTEISAYLVSVPHAPVLESETADTSTQGNGTEPEQVDSNTSNLDTQDLEQETPTPIVITPGSDLTQEDMDLIDVLWRQDIDLGVGREAFDINLRKELEKEKEVELLKDKEQENKEEASTIEKVQQVAYEVDSETGELVAVPCQNSPAQVVPEAAQGTPNNSDIDQTIEDALSVFEQHANNTEDVNKQETVSVQQNMPQANFGRQESVEARWGDIQNLINCTDNKTDINDNNTISMDVDMMNITSANSLLDNNTNPINNNQSLAQALLADLPTPEPIAVNPFNTSFNMAPPQNNMTYLNLDNQSQTTNNNSIVNNTMDFNNTFNNTFNNNFSMPMEGFNNLTNAALGASNFDLNLTNTTGNSLLADLLEDLDFTPVPENNNTDATMTSSGSYNETYPDSAVGSSMSGSSSPYQQEIKDGASNITSPFEALGATGGTDEPERKFKFEPYDHEYSTSLYTNGETYSDTSSSSNDTDFDYIQTETDKHNIAHNHTYPLKPGQVPKERKKVAERVEREADPYVSARDEKKMKTLKIPFTSQQIINSPVEEFNEMVNKYSLTDAQLQLIRDVRRRGKNKVAAQNCRKRKIEEIGGLEEEVTALRRERDRLLAQKKNVAREATDMKDRHKALYDQVFRSLRDDQGRPYNPEEYMLHQTPEGDVFLVPRRQVKAEDPPQEKDGRKKRGKKGGR